MVDPAPRHASAPAVDSETAKAALAEARAIVHRIVGQFPVRVYLFGSRARGTSRPASDIDIALLPTGDVPNDLVARLRDAFEESTIPYVVDVVDLSRADESLRHRVMREGLPWDD